MCVNHPIPNITHPLLTAYSWQLVAALSSNHFFSSLQLGYATLSYPNKEIWQKYKWQYS